MRRWSRCAKDARACWACRFWRCFPSATILWTNLHGGFFVGILMIVAYGGGRDAARWSLRPTADRAGRRGCRARGYF